MKAKDEAELRVLYRTNLKPVYFEIEKSCCFAVLTKVFSKLLSGLWN